MQKLQSLITLKLLGEEDDPNAAIKEAIEILDIFNSTNTQRPSPLDYREFCNDAINQEVNLQDHLEEWLDQRAALRAGETYEEKFCLCNYPWILNTASKSDILVWDSKDKMKGEIDKELINNLLTNLNGGGDGSFNFAYLYLEIQREQIIETTLNHLVNQELNYRKPLKIKFIGEPGVDEGGVQKEFFQLLIKDLFDPNYTMFKYNKDSRLLWFNGNTFETSIKFELIGILMGVAIYNNISC